MLEPPYDIVLKPYGQALVDLAQEREDVVCLGADLTRQTETDLFRDTIPERFFNVGMAEANAIGIAGGLARAGHTVFFNTFGVFATRRCLDQIAMAVAYPALNVKVIGFMPGLSSPGGPSHQAIEDVAIMRALPSMTVVDVADATETRQAVRAIAEIDGPVYMRLKRGEIPVIFDLPLNQTTDVVLTEDVPLFANATFTLPGGGGQINGRVDIVLPRDLVLPVRLDMTVPVNTTIPVRLPVDVEIPLNETQLHDPFTNLRDLLEPYVRVLDHLPGKWGDVPDFVIDILQGEGVDLVAPSPDSQDPWPGFTTGTRESRSGTGPGGTESGWLMPPS